MLDPNTKRREAGIHLLTHIVGGFVPNTLDRAAANLLGALWASRVMFHTVLIITFGTVGLACAWLAETCAPFRLLLDPPREVYSLYGLQRSFWRSWNLKTIWRYVQLLAAGCRWCSIQGDSAQLGGDFIVDAGGIVRLAYQLAVAPFAPDGSLELAAVLTPHIGGVVEFYRLEDNGLKIVAQMAGYTSHTLGTRNLDMAAAGDFDGDGRLELLLPNQRRTELGAIRRTADGAMVAWTIPLDSALSTNLAGVTLPDGHLVVGAGQDDGRLRVWGP